MKQFFCPTCGGVAAWAGGKPYCRRCGWNFAATESALRRSLKHLPMTFVVIVLLGVTWLGWWNGDWDFAALMVCTLGAFVGAGYLLSRRALRRLLAERPAGPGAVPADGGTEPALATTSGPPPAGGATPLLVARPRRLRLSRRGRRLLAIVFLVVAGFEAVLIPALIGNRAKIGPSGVLPPELWIPAGLAALIPFILVGFWQALARERRLLTHGEVALARVTQQQTWRGNHYIYYEFRDASGRRLERRTLDYSSTLFEGMSFPVFYERNDPGRHVALCEAFHEVVPPTVERTPRSRS